LCQVIIVPVNVQAFFMIQRVGSVSVRPVRYGYNVRGSTGRCQRGKRRMRRMRGRKERVLKGHQVMKRERTTDRPNDR